MCHHYTNADSLPEHFVSEFSLRANQREVYRGLAAALLGKGAWPLKTVPALRIDPSGELEAVGAEWGLLPRWWKPSDKQPQRAAFQRGTFNARSETAATKPSFREAMRRRRCLLPLAEFFERGSYFGLRTAGQGEPMAFAGLWEAWSGAEADVLSATLLTTEPNADVRRVGHDRMPVLLTTPDMRRRWLVDGAEGPDDPLLMPAESGILSVRAG